MATKTTADAEEDEELKRKLKLEEEKIRQVQYDLNHEFTDPIKESTVEYYHQNKDKVRPIGLLSCIHYFQSVAFNNSQYCFTLVSWISN